MPHLVRPRLFIGDIFDAAETLQGRGIPEITHVVSLLSSAAISFFTDWRRDVSIPAKEIRRELFGGSVRSPSQQQEEDSPPPEGKLMYSLQLAGPELRLLRMAVPLRDTEGENLLDYLDACIGFIDKGRGKGSVLVHCFAGVSRSASVITAYLMRKEQRSLEDALESLRESSELVCPNDGFQYQLKMFEEMSFKVDVNSSIYKRFRLKMLGHSYKLGEKVCISEFASDPGSSEETNLHEKPAAKSDQHTMGFRCKKCGRIVALKEHVISHEPGEGESSFKWQKRKAGYRLDSDDDPECSSLFVEPLRWMTSVEEGALDGKLSCAHCEARLGHFNWSGIQCSCGSWITPAFQIHKSRVDACTV